MKIDRKRRRQQSLVLLALHVVMTILHTMPQLVYPDRAHRTTTRIVALISELGPGWVGAFGVTSVIMIVTLWRGRGEGVGHAWCGAVWVVYSIGLWLGALADSPHGTVVFPCVATIIVAIHSVLASSYADDPRPSVTRLGEENRP